MNEKDYYQILGVSLDSDEAAIKKAYFELAKKYHPDKTTDPEEKMHFQNIKEAYETLGNKEKKLSYDATLHPADSTPLEPSEKDKEMALYRKERMRASFYKLLFSGLLGGCIGYVMSIFFLPPTVTDFQTLANILSFLSGMYIVVFLQMGKHFYLESFIENPAQKKIFVYMKKILFLVSFLYLSTFLITIFLPKASVLIKIIALYSSLFIAGILSQLSTPDFVKEFGIRLLSQFFFAIQGGLYGGLIGFFIWTVSSDSSIILSCILLTSAGYLLFHILENKTSEN